MVVVAALAVALTALGCGAASHPNEPRPQSPTRVSVTISENGVVVQPARVGVGPERSQQLPQNQNRAQPPIKTTEPLNVVFVAANQTESRSHLQLEGPKRATSGALLPYSPGTFSTALPTGIYTISATGVPGAPAARLVVGPVRTSSENDVLLP